MSKLNLIGNRYGKWTVIEKPQIVRRRKNGDTVGSWICRCDCGTVKEVLTNNLLRGDSKSCGCSWSEGKHNMKNTRLYSIWCNMKSRCYYVKNTYYKNYGARGVTVCDEWKNNFLAFYEWAMSHGYSDNLTLERIDVNGNYEPDNCKWISKEAQSCNRRHKNKSGYTGVFYNKKNDRYTAIIKKNGERIFYYSSRSKNDCAEKWNEFVLKNGMDYPLNIISENLEDIRAEKRHYIKRVGK